MNTGTLEQLITKIGYDNSFGIYAEFPFTPDSPARIGQTQFDQGGILDGKAFFADGVQVGDFLADYADGEATDEFSGREYAEAMIEELNLNDGAKTL